MDTDLLAQAKTAHLLLERAAGIAQQVADGSTELPDDPQRARDAVDRLRAAAETARLSRVGVGAVGDEAANDGDYWPGILPLNRKERFYTGTVFPAIVTGQEFWHLQRCLDLFDLPVVLEEPKQARVQFITEYGFAESVHTDADKAEWRTDLKRDTPDIVIAGPDWLLIIEAKMFHNPSAADLRAQLDLQKELVAHWTEVRRIPEDRVVHALLLPERLATRHREALADVTVVTWEQIADAYRRVASSYWINLLDDALSRHEELESKGEAAFGANSDAWLTGQEILDRWQALDSEYTYMGRNRGLHGPELAADLHSGEWRTRKYEVRKEPRVARNWFPVADFVTLVPHD